MSKRILITATELHLVQFWIYHIDRLIKDGFEVELVCSNVGDKLEQLKEKLVQAGNPRLTVVNLHRNPLNPDNINGYRQLRKYFKNNDYDIVITNEPVMGVMTRLAARDLRRRGTKVIYFAHGFHFWKGAPALNWMLFYPIERFASHFTDLIVTMNTEDYNLAEKDFKSCEVKYTYGIGARLEKFCEDSGVRKQKRDELGINGEKVIFTVSELTDRKNLYLAFDAVKRVVEDGYDVKYYIRGVGPLEADYRKYLEENGLSDRVFLLGYGKDIMEMNNAADVFLFTSKQEGLPVAVMEAMSCNTPCVVSDIRGVNDLISDENGGYLCPLGDSDAFALDIEKILKEPQMKAELTEHNKEKLEPYRIENVYEFLKGLVS